MFTRDINHHHTKQYPTKAKHPANNNSAFGKYNKERINQSYDHWARHTANAIIATKYLPASNWFYNLRKNIDNNLGDIKVEECVLFFSVDKNILFCNHL